MSPARAERIMMTESTIIGIWEGFFKDGLKDLFLEDAI